MPKKMIGFKNENEKTESDAENTESTNTVVKLDPKIAEDIENRITNQYEFQEHMAEHEKLIKENDKYKKIFTCIIVGLLIIVYGFIAYNKGAKDQASGVGPYAIYQVDGKSIVVHK